MPYKTTIKCTLALACALTITFGNGAHAEIQHGEASQVSGGIVQELGGNQRINLSGKLRMLSQRIPAAACNLNAGIAAEDSRAVLSGAVEEFALILDALEHGNDDLGIYGPEERARTLRTIEELHDKLEPILTVLEDGSGEVPNDNAIQLIADENINILVTANLLVSEISGEYSNPAELLQSDAITIDIAGRQRMLTQKVSKEICLTLSRVNESSSRETLGNTIHMFEASLDALQYGMENVGIQPPPNTEIAEGLVIVRSDWNDMKPYLDAIDAGQKLTSAERATVFLGLNRTMADMNRV
ncbi:MAG: type IV pili methyl-accepting chemotaxis transducer N-terminal domain-containing protein, partial [Pseudomonadota bacterium]